MFFFINVVIRVSWAVFELTSWVDVILFPHTASVFYVARQVLILTPDQLFKMSDIVRVMKFLDVFGEQKVHVNPLR